MIIFEKIAFKNFLSFGNNWTEIDLVASKNTLVVGGNGSGKSSAIIDAVTFALFGRTYKNINKPMITNSVNKKECEVILQFKIGKSSYKIKRGLHPAIFEVYKNGKMVDQDAKAKDYQTKLENNILKFNYHTFTQVIVMGSASYQPFMSLPAWARRSVVEKLLDIEIFSDMHQLVKDRLGVLKNKMLENEYNLSLIEEKIKIQTEHIQTWIKKKQERIDADQKKIVSLEKENAILLGRTEKLQTKHAALIKQVNAMIGKKDKQAKFLGLESDLEKKKKKILKEISFYDANSNCPTCKQDIAEDHKDQILIEQNGKAEEVTEALTTIEKRIDALENELADFSKIQDAVQVAEKKISDEQNKICVNQGYIQKIQKEITGLQQKSDDLSESEAQLTDYQKTEQDEKDIYWELKSERNLNECAYSILKDNGIKTKIIEHYLPAINKHVNTWLNLFNLPVNFTLDDTFKETIRSRYRDCFCYESFSEGEKCRIDLALLFTWREISKMKKSVHCNLLIFDEIFDGSMDGEGIEDMMKIIQREVSNTNIFVISHRDDMKDKFEDTLVFEKIGNFSRLQSRDK